MAERIVVGMSGGVDSSVAAALLVEQGCDVVGITMRVWRPGNPRKDQPDFLGPPPQAQLGPARFPIGERTKDEVRARARRLGLVTADKPESQDICFVPDDDYRGFLRRRAPEVFRPGAVVDRRGNTLGAHAGIAGFTVGQKRGLGLATGRPLYVVDLDPERDTGTVGEA